MPRIQATTSHDIRFDMPDGGGSDAVHVNPQYSYAVTVLEGEGIRGSGFSFTLGDGNDVVTELAGRLAAKLIDVGGRDIEEIMARFGEIQKTLADDSQLRWLGPHKGAIHLALSSVTNAALDLWARARNMPLWELLLSLDDLEVAALLDLSWIEDVLDKQRVLELLADQRPSRPDREGILETGYPGYDTSVGWLGYSDEVIAERTKSAVDRGFQAMKLKVGSADLDDDLRRFRIVRENAGDDVLLMVDANQQWRHPLLDRACAEFADLGAYWIEEPTHPDDVLTHRRLAQKLRSTDTRLALGEHVSNRVLFRNFIEAGAVDIVQVDAMRVAGVTEFIIVSMLAKQAGLSLIPHVGDVGQLHRHLVFFNHIALGLPAELLEYIPHLTDKFEDPAVVENGRYILPKAPGAGMRLKEMENG